MAHHILLQAAQPSPHSQLLPVTFEKSQSKDCLYLSTNLSTFIAARVNRLNANRAAGQRPSRHGLNSFASLVATEIGAGGNGTYKREQKSCNQKSHE
jgi:hypothetical protein